RLGLRCDAVLRIKEPAQSACPDCLGIDRKTPVPAVDALRQTLATMKKAIPSYKTWLLWDIQTTTHPRQEPRSAKHRDRDTHEPLARARQPPHARPHETSHEIPPSPPTVEPAPPPLDE